MQTINRLEAYKLITQEDEGKIFSVIFTKKDGERRDMVCRRGVNKGVTGQGYAFDPAQKALVSVFDMQKEDFRFISLNTITSLKIKGQEFHVIDQPGDAAPGPLNAAGVVDINLLGLILFALLYAAVSLGWIGNN